MVMRADHGLMRFASPGEQAPRGAEATRARLFSEVLVAGPLSRTDLAVRTDLSPSTVTKMINPLIEAGYVLESGAASSGMGRPRQLLRVAAERYAVVGVKIAPASVTGVLADLQAQVLAKRRRQMPACDDPAAVTETAAEVITELLDVPSRGEVLGTGVGIGGHVDSRSGSVIWSGIMGWADTPVAAPLADATGLPVVVDNDVNALAIGERWFGAGRRISSLALVTVGRGIGSAFLLDGQPLTGVSGLAGELGHIPVRPGGLPCSCGNTGCLETVASDAAILRGIVARGGSACPDITAAVEAARAGDPAAVAAFESMGAELGRGLATICNLLNPERIVLTGERASAFDLFGAACSRAWQAAAFSTAARDCELVVDDADDTQWARGAACLVIREAVSRAGAR